MADRDKAREAVKTAVVTNGPVYVNAVVKEVYDEGVSATDAKAAARHLVQSGSLGFDDEMKLVAREAKIEK